MDALIAAAKAEGGLTTIALPRDWCNYGEPPSTASPPSTGSRSTGSTRVAARRTSSTRSRPTRTTPDPQAPDVVDVGLAFGPQGVDQGLFQPYKVATWDTIPDAAKSADGMWYGDYYGVLSFEVNTKVVTNVPKDWPDLLKPEYKSRSRCSVTRSRRTRPSPAVWAAGLSPNGGTLDSAKAGLDFFKQLNDAGNFVPVIASTATVASGDTPIRLGWTYNALADKDSAEGQSADRRRRPDVRPLRWHVRPGHQRLRPASERRQALDGVPVLRRRPEHLAERATATRSATTTWLPRAPSIRPRWRSCPTSKGTRLPTLAQITAASKAITAGWPTVVGVTVK